MRAASLVAHLDFDAVFDDDYLYFYEHVQTPERCDRETDFIIGALGLALEKATGSQAAATTSGCTRGPGFVPADTAWALAGSASWLKNAAAICERPAL